MKNLEQQELIQKLIDGGHRELVETLLLNHEKAFTRGGRANKSGICRLLKIKSKHLEDALIDCRRILGDDIYP